MSSLREMMEALTFMERVHDEMPEITPDMVAEHFDAVKEIDQKVDNIAMFMSSCRHNAALYSDRAEAYRTKSRRFDAALAACEKYVLHLLKTFPDVEFRGKEVRFKKAVNPPALVCNVIGSKSYSAVIHEDALEEIPERYREPRVVWQLKTSAVKKDLEQEKDLGFASVRRSERLVTEIKLKEEK